MERYGLLDESLQYCMDYEYWLRLGKSGVKFAYLQEKIAGSRLYPGNKTLHSKVKVHREINTMQRKMLGNVHDHWLYGYAQIIVDQRKGGHYKSNWITLEIWVRSMLAALRWNKKVSANTAKTVYNWLLERE